VPRKTTVGEWVMRPIRAMVSVMRTIWRTVTEAVARFITVARKVIDKIVHSEWVTTFKQVAKTFWETVTEKVPLLGLFGKFLGFIWKTVVKPIIRWITEAVRTLRTWIENVIRWIVEKIQDGWNYITKQISETVREWVEKTDWVRDWVTKEITVWETVWENKFYAFPIPLGGGGGKLAIPAQQTWSNLLAKVGLTVMLGTLAVTLKDCIPTATPPCTPTPALTSTISPDILATAWGFYTQTAQAAFTPTPMPMGTATPDPLNTEQELHLLLDWLITHRNDPAVQQWLIQHGLLNPADIGNDTKLLEAVNQAVIPWQNQYNADIQRIAIENNIPPEYLKALFLQENQFGWTPVLNNPNANGPGQLFGWGLDMAFNNGTAPNVYIKAAYERSGQVFYNAEGSAITPYDPQFNGDFQAFYKALSYDSQTSLRGFAIPFVNLTCDNYETCPSYGGLKPDEAIANLEVSTQALVGARNIAQQSIGNSIWNQIPTSEQMKFAIAIYNSGGGTCVGDAINKTKDSGGNPGNWEQVKANLGSNCTAAGAYVDGVTSYLP
jgi:hypothetical protein